MRKQVVLPSIIFPVIGLFCKIRLNMIYILYNLQREPFFAEIYSLTLYTVLYIQIIFI